MEFCNKSNMMGSTCGAEINTHVSALRLRQSEVDYKYLYHLTTEATDSLCVVHDIQNGWKMKLQSNQHIWSPSIKQSPVLKGHLFLVLS